MKDEIKQALFIFLAPQLAIYIVWAFIAWSLTDPIIYTFCYGMGRAAYVILVFILLNVLDTFFKLTKK